MSTRALIKNHKDHHNLLLFSLLLRNRSPISQFPNNGFSLFSFSTKPEPPPNPNPNPNPNPIDAGSSIRKPINMWPGPYNSPVTNALWEARSVMNSNLSNSLSLKFPSQSRTTVTYRFSSDEYLREQYRNPWGHVRIGKLLEDLDALAGTVAFKHCSGTAKPLLLVTASVDRILIDRQISVDFDLSLVGAVTWSGRSSLDIQLCVVQDLPEESDRIHRPSLAANFTFVARDTETGAAAPVNKVVPETEEERELWREAEERKEMRKKRKTSETENDCENGKRLEALLAEGRVFGDMPALANRDSIVLSHTRLENSFICQPQQRNVHGRIFGGFLLRRAFEIAFATAYAFAGAAPLFLEVDHVDFLKPVDVGNFLRMKSCVLYTQLENPAEPLINVEVIAHVTKPELRSSEVSNKFYFTFTVIPEALKDGLRIRNVVPSTEEEAKRVLERMDAEAS